MMSNQVAASQLSCVSPPGLLGFLELLNQQPILWKREASANTQIAVQRTKHCGMTREAMPPNKTHQMVPVTLRLLANTSTIKKGDY